MKLKTDSTVSHSSSSFTEFYFHFESRCLLNSRSVCGASAGCRFPLVSCSWTHSEDVWFGLDGEVDRLGFVLHLFGDEQMFPGSSQTCQERVELKMLDDKT